MSTRNAAALTSQTSTRTPKVVGAPKSAASRRAGQGAKLVAPAKSGETVAKKAPVNLPKSALSKAAKSTATVKTTVEQPKKSKNSSAKTTPAPGKKSVALPVKPVRVRKKTESPKTLLQAADGTTAVRAKRARVPADLAQQYGEKAARKAPAPKETAAARKARRNAEERAKLRELMTPDEELIQRLARLRGEVTPVSNGKTKTASTRRSRSWESRCGKCGTNSTFKTAAALCTKCGAIAVRVLD